MKTASSNVSAVVKDRDDLCVRFHSGKCYRYIGAGALFDDIVAASSIGSFLNKEVKPHYEFGLMDSEKFDELETISGVPEILVFRFTGGKGCYF